MSGRRSGRQWRDGFPAFELFALEPQGQARLGLELAIDAAAVDVIPAVRAERINQGGRTDNRSDLGARHARLQARNRLGAHDIALRQVHFVS